MIGEKVILKGTNTKFTGYPTDSDLSGSSGYQIYYGFFFELSLGALTNEGENVTFASSFKSSNSKHRVKLTIRTEPKTYPNSAISFEDFFNDTLGNSIYDVINCKYLYIKNDTANNPNPTRLNLVPSSEADYLTKNRAVTLISLSNAVDDGTPMHYHLEGELEYASR
jgi:hypothetical protein